MALIGIGPGPVEHIFAIGMLFQVQRHGAKQCVPVLEQQVLRCPAGGGASASGVVQGVQEDVLQERVVTGEPVPSLRINRIKGCCYLQIHGGVASKDMRVDDILAP